MASSEQVPSTLSPLAAAGDSAAVPLTVPPEPPRPEPGAAAGWRDLTLVVLVMALAFVLASFPARNSDLWKHLATGRLLAHGETSPTANPGWLYDLLCYGLYSALGGGGLVFLKALLVVGIAVVVLRLSRVGRGWILAAVCTALALVAMSTRLLLQSALLSCFLLSLTLLLLRWGEEQVPERRWSWLPPWPLLVLFVVWANLDSWFLLGLLMVALIWLGRSLDAAQKGDHQLLCWVLPWAVLVAACLLNPSHVHAFTLPPELAPALTTDVGASPIPLTSPFQRAYFTNLGLTPAGLAYYPLLGLGLLSFAINLPRTHWQRFLPWAVLALLSAVQVRTLPFFAVVAAPVLAWNLHSWAVRRAPGTNGRLAPGAAGGLAVVLGLVLVVCAWPGWLQARTYEPPRWSVEPPHSFELAAAAVRRWHEEKKLPADSIGLHLSADTVNAFAWFCPEDASVIDPSLTAALRGEPGANEVDARERLRAAQVNHVIVYDPIRSRFLATLARLWSKQKVPMLYLDGDLAIFGWLAPAADTSDPFENRQLDLQQMAFDPPGDQRAPRAGPVGEPQRRAWWEALWKPAPPRPIAQDEAEVYLLYAKVVQARIAPRRIIGTWLFGQPAALVGAAASWSAGGSLTPAASLLGLHVNLLRLRPQPPDRAAANDSLAVLRREAWQWYTFYLLAQDEAPSELLYLAVRAARRALIANPSSVEAQLSLGESYMSLMRSTRERAWARQMSDLAELRSVQASAALNRAVALQPNSAQAHLRLYELYLELNYLDLALEHLRTYLKLTRETAPRGGDSEASRQQDAPDQERLNLLVREVEDRENTFAAGAVGAQALDRATLAAEKGLAGKALDILLHSDVSAFGDQGMELELRLMLTTGRSRDAREWIAPSDRPRLGPTMYHWLRIQSLAASGDYELVQTECDAMLQALALTGPDEEPVTPRMMLGWIAGQMVLEERPGDNVVAHLVRRAPTWRTMLERISMLAQRLTQEAHIHVLRGLFALEEGRVSEARFYFREALGLWRNAEVTAKGGGLDFTGRVVAQGCLEWLP
jgi:hypothetical protein